MHVLLTIIQQQKPIDFAYFLVDGQAKSEGFLCRTAFLKTAEQFFRSDFGNLARIGNLEFFIGSTPFLSFLLPYCAVRHF